MHHLPCPLLDSEAIIENILIMSNKGFMFFLVGNLFMIMLMRENEKNGKKPPNFRSNFDPFDPNLDLSTFFRGFYLY